MSLFESFLGGAAEAGTSMLKNQMAQEQAEEQAKRMAKFQEEIAMERAKTIAEMKRAMDLKAGQEISAEAERLGKSRISKDMDTNNPIADQSTWTPEMEAARNQGKQSLMDSMTNAQKLGDRANAALKLGYIDQAKEIRGHQQIEMQSERDSRKEEHDIRREDLADMRYQTEVEWRKERAAVEDRLATVRERLAGAAEARAGRAEKTQATAMEKAELNSSRQSLQAILKDVAQQEEKINSQMALIQSKIADPMLSEEQKKPFVNQLKTLEQRSNGLDVQRVSVRNELRALNGMEPYKEEKETPVKTNAPPNGTRGTMNGVPGVVTNGVFVPDVQPAKKDDAKKEKKAENNYPVYKTFEPTVKATEAELSQAKQEVDAAKATMDANRNAKTINAYNQAVTKFTALSHRGL